jgi:hypothetical protein
MVKGGEFRSLESGHVGYRRQADDTKQVDNLVGLDISHRTSYAIDNNFQLDRRRSRNMIFRGAHAYPPFWNFNYAGTFEPSLPLVSDMLEFQGTVYYQMTYHVNLSNVPAAPCFEVV